MDALLKTADHWLSHWLELVAQTRRWQTSVEIALTPHDIGMNELLVLKNLHEAPEPGLTQIELVRRLALSPALMSGLMESLQQRQWIQTIRSPQDRRRVLCSLSPVGRLQFSTILQDLMQKMDVPHQPRIQEVAA